MKKDKEGINIYQVKYGYRLPSCIIHKQFLYLMHIKHLNLQYDWRIYTLEPEGTYSWTNVII